LVFLLKIVLGHFLATFETLKARVCTKDWGKGVVER
jgi:hypothetical protein